MNISTALTALSSASRGFLQLLDIKKTVPQQTWLKAIAGKAQTQLIVSIMAASHFYIPGTVMELSLRWCYWLHLDVFCYDKSNVSCEKGLFKNLSVTFKDINVVTRFRVKQKASTHRHPQCDKSSRQRVPVLTDVNRLSLTCVRKQTNWEWLVCHSCVFVKNRVPCMTCI